MPKINQEEYEILQPLNNTKDWIVRNLDGQLWAVEGEPPRKSSFYETWKEGNGRGVSKVDVSLSLFQFIQWEDEEPYNIQELIEEYESQFIETYNVQKELEELDRLEESEETEVKDKQWLIKEVKELSKGFLDHDILRDEPVFAVLRNDVLKLIDQLDEPEVLSQEWIDEHEIHYNHWVGAVPVTDLQNLLVPKQEVNLKIQGLIEKYEQEDGEHSNPENAWIDDFIYDLESLIEKEQKYYVLDSEEIPLLERVNGQTCKTTTGLSIYEDGRDNSRFELTEQEIKGYDERFWPFAVKVEELEE